jgi:phosphatidylglycerophosphate synthase
MKHLPILLIMFRLALAPTILLLAHLFGTRYAWAIVTCLYLALLSDFLDGYVARHLGIATEKLRRLDSQVDLVFWLSAGICIWWLHPNIIAAHLLPIGALLGLELACYLASWLKFGKETCTHAFLSKLWGLSLLISFTFAIGWGTTAYVLPTAIGLGLVSQLDVLIIILILPRWTHDIPSAYHAWLIRKGRGFRKYKLLN